MTDEEKLLVELEQRCKSNSHRLDEVEKTAKAIYEMSASVQLLGQNIRTMTEEIKEQGRRLEKLEEVPADNWKAVVRTCFTAAVSALAGAAMALIVK